jgi:putative phosphoribosyl transferase
MVFTDRIDAGIKLAERLAHYQGQQDVVVWGLPRGGVIVALEVARALRAPLGVCSVRKLGVPGQPELAMGAVAIGGVRVLNKEIVAMLRIDDDTIEEITRREEEDLQRLQQALAGDRAVSETLVDPADKTAILVDDGLATGATMRAVIEAARQRDPERIVVAVPVAPPDVRIEFERLADEVVCVATPEPFYGVGAWYRDFRQTTDRQVREALEQARAWSAPESNA